MLLPVADEWLVQILNVLDVGLRVEQPLGLGRRSHKHRLI